MAGYWPRSFIARLLTSTASRSINTQKKKELSQYPAILTSYLVNNPYIFSRPTEAIVYIFRGDTNLFLTHYSHNCYYNYVMLRDAGMFRVIEAVKLRLWNNSTTLADIKQTKSNNMWPQIIILFQTDVTWLNRASLPRGLNSGADVWCLQNSTWHLRRRIARGKIISQKWNKNKLPDNKAFCVVLCGMIK